MKLKAFIFSIFFLQSLGLLAQVGINNASPAATLHVVGDVLVQDRLYLESPGSYNSGPNSKLLMFNDISNAIIKFDLTASTFGPLNYVRFVFNNTSDYGLDEGYDTKIDAAKYTVAVHGYSFNRSGNTNVSLRSEINNTFVEGHQFYAYVQNGTWWVRAMVNNSRFRLGNALTAVDIFMDLIVYRNNFITKIWDTPLTVNMGTSPSATAPLPAGF